MRFERGRPLGSDAVLFLADQSCCSRPNEEWCPNVTLFEDRFRAARWAEEHGVDGRVVSLEGGTELGTMEWRPLVEVHPWMEAAASARAEPPYLTMSEGLKLASQAFTRELSRLSCCAA